MNGEVVKIGEIGYIDAEKGRYPCARLSFEEPIAIDITFIIGTCVSLYDAFLSNIPDEHQLEFEAKFKERFFLTLENRANYMEDVKYE